MQGMFSGEVFAGDFQIIRPLGTGGMGSVYLALQLSTGRKRALKVLQPHWIADPRMRARFALEARAASGLQTDHVVEVVAAGIDEPTGMPWLAMEYLDGETLAARVRNSTRLRPTEVGEVLRQLSHGLATAHRAGLVHRDIKPANIFIADPRREGVPFTVKLLDFGIVQLAAHTGHAAVDRGPIGSPGWMAPEQFEGRAATPASDIFSLGLTAYFALVGTPYWNNRDDIHALHSEVMAPHRASAAERASHSGVQLPAGFDAWFARCTALAPEQRFNDVGSAIEALAPILTEAPSELGAVAPVAAGPATASVRAPIGGEMTLPTQPRTLTAQHSPATASYGTFSPIAHPTSPPQPTAATPRNGPPWLLLGAGAALVLGLVGVAGAAAVGISSGWLADGDGAAAPITTNAPSEPLTPSADTPATTDNNAANSDDSSADGAEPPKSAKPSAPPVGAKTTKPPPAASAKAPPSSKPEGPTPTAAAGYRALMTQCWKDNEGATSKTATSVSATVGIDGRGLVRSVLITGATAYPHTRRCITTRSTGYSGFRPPTFTSAVITAQLPAATPKAKPASSR